MHFLLISFYYRPALLLARPVGMHHEDNCVLRRVGKYVRDEA